MPLTFKGKPIASILFNNKLVNLFKFKGRPVWEKLPEDYFSFTIHSNGTTCKVARNQKYTNSRAIISILDIPAIYIDESGKIYKVTEIDEEGFSKCCAEVIVFPRSIELIGQNAFENCNYLKTLIFTKNSRLKWINDKAFYECKKLKTINLQEAKLLQTIGSETFAGCLLLDNIRLPESLQEIGSKAFENCINLKSIVIPNNVAEIGQAAFKLCSKLAWVYIYSPNIILGAEAFWTNIELAVSEKTFIVFHHTPTKDLSEIAYTVRVSTDCVFNQSPFDFTLIEGQDSYQVKMNTRYFTNLSQVDGIVAIPNLNVLSIPEKYESKPVVAIEHEAFNNNISIQTLIIPNTVTVIGNDAFSGCTALREVEWGNSVQNIGDRTFKNCENLTLSTLPESLISIGTKAFYGCFRLKSINVPYAVNSIGHAAFANSNNVLVYSHLLETADAWKISNIETNNPRLDCQLIWLVSAQGTHEGYNYLKYYDGTVKIISSHVNTTYLNIPQQIDSCLVTSISSQAFKDCTNLESIVIPNSVVAICDSAFCYCYWLTNIYYSGGIEDWNKISISYNNSPLENATVYYYSETEPAEEDSFWHWGENGEVKIWVNEHVHTEEILPAIAPTCNTTGLTEGKKCSECGEILIAQEVVNIVDHNYINGKCEFCGIIWDEYLKYTLSNNTYSVEAKNINNIPSTLVIPASYNGIAVTSIGNYAFRYCSSLTSVVIPDSVTSIGHAAFDGCSSLVSVTIPDSVTSIGYNAFLNCSSLKSVVIPKGVASIGGTAFSGCTSLTKVSVLGEEVELGGGAFQGCSALEKVVVGEYITYQNMGYSCDKLIGQTIEGKTANIVIGNGCSISSTVFSACAKLTGTLIIGDNCIIDQHAFHSCKKLESVVIGDSAEINRGAFAYCSSITSITIGNSVNISAYYRSESNWESPFAECTQLEKVTIGDGSSIGDYAFKSCSSLVSVVIGGAIESLDWLTTIGNYAFFNCESLNELTINNTVDSIGDSAFEGCETLTYIEYKGVRGNVSIGSDAFARCGTGSTELEEYFDYRWYDWILEIIKAICEWIFGGPEGESAWNSLSSTSYMSNITTIGCRGFYNWQSQKIILPKNVEEIRSQAFDSCPNLTQVTLSSKVHTVQDNAFINCPNLTIYCEAVSKPDSWGTNWNADKRPVVWNCNKGYTSHEYFTYIPLADSTVAIKAVSEDIPSEINIPALSVDGLKVTAIADGAFAGCANLTNVSIPHGVTTIGDSAFANCTNLIDINIPKSITHIGKQAFYKCTSLFSVSIPSSVTSIASWAFRDCTSLESVLIPSSVTEIGTQAFICEDNSFLTIYCEASEKPSGWHNNWNVTTILANNRFSTTWDCLAPTSDSYLIYTLQSDDTYAVGIGGGTEIRQTLPIVSIPSTYNGKAVTAIADFGFANCFALSKIAIPDSIIYIGKNAFQSCINLADIVIPGSVKQLLAGAFMGCRSLTSIRIPDSVSSVYDKTSMFSGCASLEEIILPKNWTSIGDYMFYGCTKLLVIQLPDRVNMIGQEAFEGCDNLRYVYLRPTNWSILKEGTSSDLNLADNDAAEIASYLTNDYVSALWKAKPHKMPIIGAKLLSSNVGLDVLIKNPNQQHSPITVEMSLINNSSIVYTKSKEGSIRGNSQVTYTFAIPLNDDGTDVIDFNRIELKAYFDTGDEAKVLLDIENNFSYTLIRYDDYAIKAIDTSKIIEQELVILPLFYAGNITAIGDNAFEGADITRVILHSRITSIGKNAFSNTLLEDVTIPLSVNYMGEDVFKGVSDLKVYCEAYSRPDTWDVRWDTDVNEVIWHCLCAEEHAYQAINSIAPTCTDKGYTIYHCTNCDHVYHGSYIDAFGHTEVIDPEVPATCTENGLTEGSRCTRCEEVLIPQLIIKALGHDMVVDAAVDATCTETGLTEGSHCTRCDHKVAQETVPATGHTWKAATCTEPRTCTVCGATTGNALGHDYRIAQTIPATCTEGGYTTYVCTRCDHTYNDGLVPALGHNYEAAVTAPTCTTDGYTTHTCTNDRCNSSYKDNYVDALGHNYGDTVYEWNKTKTACTATHTCANDTNHIETVEAHSVSSNTTDATCSATGAIVHTAAFATDWAGVYTETEILEIDSAAHNWKTIEYGWADDFKTCTATRICANDTNHTETIEAVIINSTETVEKTCSTAGEVIHTASFDRTWADPNTKIEIIPATGHKYSSVVTAPTCTAKGYTTYTCSRCNHVYTDNEVAATGHSFTPATCTTPKTCSTCGMTNGNALGHSWVAATCTTPKTCSTCGMTNGNALGHSWVAATCTTPKTCSVCKTTEGTVNASNHTSWNAATCTLPKTCAGCGATEGTAKGHSWKNWTITINPTCYSEGKQTRECSVCGERETATILPNAHTSGDWVITVQPTTTSTGTRVKKCTVCGATTFTETIPKLVEYSLTVSISSTPYYHPGGAYYVGTVASVEGTIASKIVSNKTLAYKLIPAMTQSGRMKLSISSSSNATCTLVADNTNRDSYTLTISNPTGNVGVTISGTAP